MITAIYSIPNFKGIYQHKYEEFSGKQQLIIKDIKEKLGDRIEQKDYYIKSSDDKNSVLLYEVNGKKQILYNNDKCYYTFEKNKFLASCNENSPLNIQKIDKNDILNKNLNGCLNVIFALMTGVVVTLTILGFAKIYTGKSCFSKNQTEMIQKADTLKNNIIKNVK